MTDRLLAHVTRRDVTTWPQYRVTKHRQTQQQKTLQSNFNVGIQQVSPK